MAASKMEQLIDDIMDFVDKGKSPLISPNKVTFHREELNSMLYELRINMPEEIAKCQKVVANRNAIIDDARKKAALIIKDATSKASVMVDNDEMVQMANDRAKQIIDEANARAAEIIREANAEADTIKINALMYTNDNLTNIEGIIQSIYNNTRADYDALLKTGILRRTCQGKLLTVCPVRIRMMRKQKKKSQTRLMLTACSKARNETQNETSDEITQCSLHIVQYNAAYYSTEYPAY
jgi:vacuolar-type H+-ATPase subunit H